MRDRLILICAALAAFGASLASQFHFDDYSIFADPALNSSSGWLAVWRPLQTRPLTYFTFWLNLELGGRNPIGYHAPNLALHLAAVLLIYGLLRRLLDPRAALFAALIFALHPIQAEAVDYIWARSSLLMTVCCLLALRCWIYQQYWTAVVCFAGALLAKEECVALPIFLACLSIPRIPPRRQLYPIAAMLALALIAGWRVLYVTRHTPGAGVGSQAAFTPAQYFLGSGPVIWRYLGLLVLPLGFTVDPQIALPPLWLGVAAWAAILALAWLALRSPAGIWFAGGLILLLPSSSIFPAADLAADRRMYLPMIAFATAAALLLARLPRPAAAALVAVLAVLSIFRTQVWMTEKSLWTEAVRRAPDKVRPKIQLARASDPADALHLLHDAKNLAPSDPTVASELGKMLLSLGRPQDALPELGRALALSPRDAEAFNNRGVALQALGQAYPARRDFEHALQLDPCLFDARYNLLTQGVSVAAPQNCRYTPEQQRRLAGGR